MGIISTLGHSSLHGVQASGRGVRGGKQSIPGRSLAWGPVLQLGMGCSLSCRCGCERDGEMGAGVGVEGQLRSCLLIFDSPQQGIQVPSEILILNGQYCFFHSEPTCTHVICTHMSSVHTCHLYTHVICTHMSSVHTCRLYTHVVCTHMSAVICTHVV
jgi:hypothetical protein